MIKAGYETTDPDTKAHSVLIKGTEEMGGRGFVQVVRMPEGSRYPVPQHRHLRWRETFEITEGSAVYRLRGKEYRLAAGQSVVFEPRVPHVHPWNAGSGVMAYRQTDDFGEVDLDAVEDVFGSVATLYGLAREGKIGRNGLLKHPLQLAATTRTLAKHGTFDGTVPVWLQRVFAATVGRLAEALGYKGVYQTYVG